MAAELTIDELARATGMTVRNIRAHQTRGLLPPPEVKGRTGKYGPEHVARLQLIHEMQGAGFNLKAIKRLVEATPDAAGEQVLHLERVLMAPWEEEEPEAISGEELASRFGGDAKTVRRAEELGVIVPLGEGRFEIPSPALLRAGEQVIAMGVPLDHAFEVLDKVRRHMRGVAREFVRLYLQDVWRPFVKAGLPADQLPPLSESLEKLRGIAWDVVRPAFQSSMTAEVETAMGKELEKLG